MKLTPLRLCIVLLGVLCWLTPLYANEFKLASDLGANARHISMGNIEGFGTDASAIFENPAGLYRVKNASVSLFSVSFLNTVYYNNVATSFKTPHGTFAFGYMGVTIPGNPVTGKDTLTGYHILIDSFTFHNWILKGAYQVSLNDHVHVAAGLNLLGQQQHGIDGVGMSADAGVVLEYGWTSASFFSRNIGLNRISYNNGDNATLTQQYIVGIRQQLSEEVAILGQVKLKEKNTLFAYAYNFRPSYISFIEFNVGLQQRIIGAIKKDTLTFGFGLFYGPLTFNYAYEKTDHVSFDNTNYFSLAIDI